VNAGEPVEFKVLGPLEVLWNDRAVPLGPPKQRLLLAVLLCHPNRLVSASRLIDALWGERPPTSAAENLRGYVHRLRRSLSAERIVGHGRPGYSLLVHPDEIDALRFVDLVHQGREALAAGRPLVACERLRAAGDLWRGAPFADLEDEPALRDEIARLEEQRLAALEERIEVDLALGRHGDLVVELPELVRRHPFRERFRTQLMIALYRCGRQADALAAYRDARRLLVDELALEPSAELHRLEQAILTGDPSLAAPAAARATTPTVAQLPPTITDFTGREGQLRRLREVLAAERPDRLPVVLVSGQAGVGKTTLAVQAAHALRARYPDGQLYASLRGVQADPLEPGQVLGQFLRAMGVDGAALPCEVEERAALYRSRLADRRVLVLLDDARDEAQVRPLLPGTPTCAALVTSRARLLGLPAALALDLEVLDPCAAVELFSRIAGPERVDAEPCQAAEIAKLCGGLPLALRVAAAPGRPPALVPAPPRRPAPLRAPAAGRVARRRPGGPRQPGAELPGAGRAGAAGVPAARAAGSARLRRLGGRRAARRPRRDRPVAGRLAGRRAAPGGGRRRRHRPAALSLP
jgi:DNA-binding SARP family transcriptional activator